MMSDAEADRFVHLIAADWQRASLAAADRALCNYAVKMTKTPAAMTAGDLDELRRYGFDDRTIHDATQVIAYFNYINRIADALHVETETFVHPWEVGF